jgi:hypothetical protein
MRPLVGVDAWVAVPIRTIANATDRPVGATVMLAPFAAVCRRVVMTGREPACRRR